MASLKKLSAMLLLISLTAVSCKSKPPKDFPDIPKPTLKQPVVAQQFCDDSGANCEAKSFCRELGYNEKTDKWFIIKEHELKFCHGIFGVNADEYNLIRKFIRDAKFWIEKNVKMESVYE